MSKDLTSLLSETIFIPQSFRELATADLSVSVRLWNVLQRLGYSVLDDLHGESYEEIYRVKNCGRATLHELKDFVSNLQSPKTLRRLSNRIESEKDTKLRQRRPETIYIPQEVRGLPLSSFPFSTRLINILRNFDFRLLGDLHGFSLSKLKTLPNCGSHTVSELFDFVEKIQKGELQTEAAAGQSAITLSDLNLAGSLEFIDKVFTEFSPRDGEIVALRFGADSGKPLTLEEIGGRYGLTRERIRQIEVRAVKKLKFRLGQAGKSLFERISRDCFAAVCPLTPQLLVHWTERDFSAFRFSPSVYVRLICEIAPEMPVLPEGQITQGQPRNENSSKISQAVKTILRETFTPVRLNEVFEQLKISDAIKNLREKDFLDALQSGSFLAYL